MSEVAMFVAICLGSSVAMWRQLASKPSPPIAPNLILWAPFWLPLVFIAYAIGCGIMTDRLIVVFVIVQLLSTGCAMLLHRHSKTPRMSTPVPEMPISN